jgi:hypothetical protein
LKAPLFGIVGMVALDVVSHPVHDTWVVLPPGFVARVPQTSQSPAVREMDVTLKAVTEETDTAEPTRTVDEINSPTLPALALSLVEVPGICPGAIPSIVFELVHSAISPAVGVPELETLPPPAGATQVPSPRQNVVFDAFVPEFRRLGGIFPTVLSTEG